MRCAGVEGFHGPRLQFALALVHWPNGRIEALLLASTRSGVEVKGLPQGRLNMLVSNKSKRLRSILGSCEINYLRRKLRSLQIVDQTCFCDRYQPPLTQPRGRLLIFAFAHMAREKYVSLAPAAATQENTNNDAGCGRHTTRWRYRGSPQRGPIAATSTWIAAVPGNSSTALSPGFTSCTPVVIPVSTASPRRR